MIAAREAVRANRTLLRLNARDVRDESLNPEKGNEP